MSSLVRSASHISKLTNFPLQLVSALASKATLYPLPTLQLGTHFADLKLQQSGSLSAQLTSDVQTPSDCVLHPHMKLLLHAFPETQLSVLPVQSVHKQLSPLS